MTAPLSSSGATQRALLRALLRGAAPAVNFSPHATKNLRRLLLAGQREQLARGEGSALGEREMETATRTLLLLLAAARPAANPSGRTYRAPVQPSLSGLCDAVPRPSASPLRAASGPRPLAHRAVANLASLTYHHLSPFVHMPRRVAIFIGGSNSRRSRRDRARIDEGAPLAALHVPAKPPRGPMAPSELKLPAWHAPPLVGLEELQATMAARKAEITPAIGTKQEESARRAYVEAKGAVKAWTKLSERETKKKENVRRPRRLLDGLMEQVQARRLHLGGTRWKTWSEGGWLGEK